MKLKQPNNICILLIALILILSLPSVYSQVIAPDDGLIRQPYLPGIMKEIKPEIVNPKHLNFYLSERWLPGSIEFVDATTLTNVRLRYDAVKHIVEFEWHDNTYVVSAKSVRWFQWFDYGSSTYTTFEPATNFMGWSEPLFGFFEVLEHSRIGLTDYKLVLHHQVLIIPATSTVSVSGSHRSNVVAWRKLYFLAIDEELFPVTRRKKDNYPLFGRYEGEMKAFIRKNGLMFRDRENVRSIFRFYFERLKDG